jgi:alpha-galactosidase
LRDALNSTGRPITYSVHWNYDNTKAPTCATGVSCPLPSVANMWRIGNDIQCDWENSVLRLIDVDTPLAANAGPGRWNDADMLQVGNGMTEDQDRAHFTMWCMLASPLIAGNDLTTMSNATRSILTNKHAIAVNQDPLGIQATLVNGTGPVDGYRIREASAGTLSSSIPSGASDTQVWAKALAATDSFAVAFLHRKATASADASITLDFHALCRPGLCGPGQNPPVSYEVYDLWADGASLGVHTGSLSFRVKPSSARMVKIVARTRALD